MRDALLAAKHARHHLDSAIADARATNRPAFLCRNLLNLALLLQAKGQARRAKPLFEKARVIAAAQRLSAYVEKIDAACG